MATTSLERIYRLQVDASNAVRGINKTNGELSKVNKSFSQVGKAAKLAFGFLSARALTGAARSILDTADAIGKASDAVGLSVENFQSYSQQASLAGVATSQFSSNLTAFVKRVGEARTGTGPLVTGLKNIDAALTANILAAGSQDEALGIVADAIQQAGTATERAAIANAAFSRSGIGMVNFLREGSAGLEEFRRQADEAGTIMSEKLVRNAEQFNDQLTTLKLRAVTSIGIPFLTVLGEVQDKFEGVSLEMQRNFENAFNFIEFEVAKFAAVVKFYLSTSNIFGQFAEGFYRIGGQFSAELQGIFEFMKSQNPAAVLNRDLDEAAAKFKVVGQSIRTSYNAATDEAIIRVNDLREAEIKLREFQASATNEGDVQRQQELTDAAEKYADALKSILDQALPEQAAADKRFDSLNFLADALERGAIEVDQYIAAVKGLTFVENEATEASATMGQALGTLVADGVTRFADSIIDLATGGKDSFKRFANSIIQDIARMIIQFQILSAIRSTNLGAQLLGSAQGNAFGPSGVIPFANGGVVTRPTLFPFAGGTGLMGEAGAEAILPLSRGSNGNLGVESTVNVNVQNNNNSQVEVQQQGNDITIILGQVAKDIASGGRISRAMESSFGVSRAARAY